MKPFREIKESALATAARACDCSNLATDRNTSDLAKAVQELANQLAALADMLHRELVSRDVRSYDDGHDAR